MRDHLLPGNKQYIEGDTIPRPQGGAGGGGSEGSPDGDGQDDFRFALSRDEFVDLFLEDLELPDLAKRRVVDSRERELASRRLFGHRLAGQPRAAAHGAQQPVAPHRAEAPEAGRAAAAARRDRGARVRTATSDARRIEPAKRSSTRKLRRTGLIPYIDPLDVRYRTLRAAAEAGGAGGDVLPDGRVRLDDRAHEGPRQAVLRAALHLPEAPLQARGRGVHPPHASGAGSGRGDILPLAGDRRHGGLHRAGGDAARRRRALQPGFVEHLRRAGVGRRQHRRPTTTRPRRC